MVSKEQRTMLSTQIEWSNVSPHAISQHVVESMNNVIFVGPGLGMSISVSSVSELTRFQQTMRGI